MRLVESGAMRVRQAEEEFRSTSWTLIRQAASDPAALAAFCEQYLTPAYAFLRRLGASRDEAEELAQDFFATHVANGRLLEQAREERGQLRGLLKTALRRWRIDAMRAEFGRNGQRAGTVGSLDEAVKSEVDATSDDLPPDAAFDRRWAIRVLEEALRRAEAECAAHGEASYWAAFEERCVVPCRLNQSPPPLDAVGAAVGLTAREVAHRLDTVRRRIRRHIERVIAEGCGGADNGSLLEDLRLVIGLVGRPGVR